MVSQGETKMGLEQPETFGKQLSAVIKWLQSILCPTQWWIYKFRKGGLANGARNAGEIFGVATPTSNHVNVRTEQL